MNILQTLFFGAIAFSLGYLVSYLVMTIGVKQDK